MRKQGTRIASSTRTDFPELPAWESSASLQASIVKYSEALKQWWWRAREVLGESISLTTDAITEGVNLFFTQKRARESVSVSAPLTYNSLEGLFGISKSGASADGYLSSADWNLFNNKISFTNALARAALSGVSPISYDSSTGAISFTGSGYVASTISVSAGSGLSGGGDLSVNRTLSINFASENTWTAVQNFGSGINLSLAAYTADDESVAYTGAADGEAKLADLNALRTAVENLRLAFENLRTQCLQ